MSLNFSRSMRRLESDGSRRAWIFLGAASVVTCLWTTWLTQAGVSVYATTGAARLEVSQENHPVDTSVLGRVIRSHLIPGQRVQAGDVLLELDATPERLARSEARAKLVPSGQ